MLVEKLISWGPLAVAVAVHTIMGRPKKAARFADGTHHHQGDMESAPQPRPHGADSEDDDDEAAEFRREAAELLKHRPRQSDLPGGLQQKQLDSAIRHFTSQTGISHQQATDALLATAEQHCKNFEE